MTRIARLLFLGTFLNGTDFGLPPPLTHLQSPHFTENTCHEKSDFYIITMIKLRPWYILNNGNFEFVS